MDEINILLEDTILGKLFQEYLECLNKKDKKKTLKILYKMRMHIEDFIEILDGVSFPNLVLGMVKEIIGKE